MLGRCVRWLRSGLTRIIVPYSSCVKMSRSRYFPNPYRGNEGVEVAGANFDPKDVKDHLIKIIEKIVTKQPAESANRDGGLYVGSAGIAYALLHVSTRLELSTEDKVNRGDYVSLAERYLKSSLRDLAKRGDRIDCGFLLGDGGTLAVAAVIAMKLGDTKSSEAFIERYVSIAELCKPESFFRAGSDEFFVGRAGYLYGSLWLNKQFGKNVVPEELMHEIARIIVRSGTKYSRKHVSPSPLMYAYYGTEYLGAAHGLCAILQVLMQVPGFLSTSEETEILVRRSVDFLLSLETPTGNYPCALDEIDPSGRSARDESNELVHWCHGSPGIVYLMAAAYLRWKNDRYLDACKRAAELVWDKGLLKKGPGICHGVAGSGYVFLLLYRLTSDSRYLLRAKKFADFLQTEEFKKGARTPDSPYSLYEGIAGTACFLADLIQPEKAAFPFQDVF